jgi:hypothetical protein
LKFFELLLYSQTNKIYAQTKKDLKYLSGYKKLFNFNCEIIYNWIDTNFLVKKNNIKKRKYIRFLFLGVVGIAQDYKLLFKIIEYCHNSSFKCTFFFIGSGTRKAELMSLTRQYKNVFFFQK